MRNLARFFLFLVLASPAAVAVAGPAEEAGVVIERWAAAFNRNDADAVAKLYAPDAILLGTVSPTIDQGSDAIHAYFTRAFQAAAERGRPAHAEIGERRTMALGETAALATGFYTFPAGPARFTMIVVNAVTNG